MTTIDIFRRARRNLAQAKVRTILTSLAIAVGAFTVTLALAAGAGGRQYTNEMINTSGDSSSLNVYAKMEEMITNELPEYGKTDDPSKMPPTTLSESDVEKIKKIAGVVKVVPNYDIQILYATRGEGYKKLVAPVVIKNDKTEVKLAAGSLIDNTIQDNGMVISEDYLSSFGFKDANDAIGKNITLCVPKLDVNNILTEYYQDRVFTISAVDHSTDATLWYSPTLSISSNDGEQIYRYQKGDIRNNQYNNLIVAVADGYDILSVQNAIKDSNYSVYSLQETKETLLQMVGIAQWGMVSFGALAILASIFGIVNTQYISVLERTRQIGLMKALGSSKNDIARLFRYEAAWVGFLGGLIGTVLAVLVGFLNPFIDQILGLEKTVKLLIFEPMTSVLLIATMVLIAVLSGYFPSRKAAKLDPIEALRTE